MGRARKEKKEITIQEVKEENDMSDIIKAEESGETYESLDNGKVTTPEKHLPSPGIQPSGVKAKPEPVIKRKPEKTVVVDNRPQAMDVPFSIIHIDGNWALFLDENKEILAGTNGQGGFRVVKR